MVAGRAQTQGVGSRPVDERIRGRIQGEGTKRGWGGNTCVGRWGGKVGRPGAIDARNESQRRHGRSGRTGRKELTLFVWKRALSFRRKGSLPRCSSARRNSVPVSEMPQGVA